MMFGRRPPKAGSVSQGNVELEPTPPSPPSGPASSIDRLTYAIGDIHGRLDLFNVLLEQICLDSATHFPTEHPRLVLLGDYVDRGPESKGVIERILALQNEGWCDTVVLLGNHDEAILNFLADPLTGPGWVEYGGATTLASYGILSPDARATPDLWKMASDAFSDAIPQSHIDLIKAMPTWFVSGDYVFVHAGLRPGVPLEEQRLSDLLWIRGEFLNAPRANERVVVHGHTPEGEPSNLPWRIGVDTGAYATGVLTAVRLRETQRSFIRSRRG